MDKMYKDRAWLYEQYVVQEKSMVDVEKEVKCSRSIIGGFSDG